MLLEKKITRFSLTDHDTIDGIQKARMLNRDRITFISGIEFTCQEKTLDAVSLPFSIHLLGYGFDENDPDLIKALEARKQRVLEVFESLLNAANISIEQAIRLIHKAGDVLCGHIPSLFIAILKNENWKKKIHGSKGRDFMGMKVLHEDWIG